MVPLFKLHSDCCRLQAHDSIDHGDTNVLGGGVDKNPKSDDVGAVIGDGIGGRGNDNDEIFVVDFDSGDKNGDAIDSDIGGKIGDSAYSEIGGHNGEGGGVELLYNQVLYGCTRTVSFSFTNIL